MSGRRGGEGAEEVEEEGLDPTRPSGEPPRTPRTTPLVLLVTLVVMPYCWGPRSAQDNMICRRCKVNMRVSPAVHHKRRKWICPKCGRARMEAKTTNGRRARRGDLLRG